MDGGHSQEDDNADRRNPPHHWVAYQGHLSLCVCVVYVYANNSTTVTNGLKIGLRCFSRQANKAGVSPSEASYEELLQTGVLRGFRGQ